MGTKIKIMDMEMDLLTEETFQEEVRGYLTNDFLNVIHFISLDYIDVYEENEVVRNALAQADLVLPGEKAVLTSYHVDVLARGGMVVDYRAALKFCDEKMLGGKTCYLILKNKKQAKEICRYLQKICPYMEITGVYTPGGDMSEEALVNDINTKIPDVIFMALDYTEGEEWLCRNQGKINAKLCVVLNSMMEMMLGENIRIPQVIQALHLGMVYRFLFRIPYRASRRRRIFHKKMDNYNNKKLLEEADVVEELSNDNQSDKE